MTSLGLRPLLLHYHIFKNAGTSFSWALETALRNRFREYDSSFHTQILSAEDIAEFLSKNIETEAISSHQTILPAPEIEGREVFTSILLRDPIARIRSIYAFERTQRVSTPGALKAKELDFKGYVEWRLSASPPMLCSYQVYFCSRTKKSKNTVPDELQFQKAVANLDQITIVGTVERYTEWLSLAQATLAAAFPGISLRASRRNVSTTSNHDGTSTKKELLNGLMADLGQTMVDRLLECNQLDMRLHQIADAMLSRKLAKSGIGINLREAYREARSQLSETTVWSS